jgi:hypothetical protein
MVSREGEIGLDGLQYVGRGAGNHPVEQTCYPDMFRPAMFELRYLSFSTCHPLLELTIVHIKLCTGANAWKVIAIILLVPVPQVDAVPKVDRSTLPCQRSGVSVSRAANCE